MLKYDLFLSFSGTRKMLYVAYGRFSLFKVEVFSNKFYKFFPNCNLSYLSGAPLYGSRPYPQIKD
jgi:hypothetical protein